MGQFYSTAGRDDNPGEARPEGTTDYYELLGVEGDASDEE